MATKIERTDIGSKNEFRLTYDNGSKKWTNDRPGDGIGDPDEKKDMLSDLTVKRGLKKLEKAVMAYAKEKESGGGNRQPIIKATKDLELHAGSDNAKAAVRAVIKAEKGVEGRERVEEGLEVAMDYLNRNRKESSWTSRRQSISRVCGTPQSGSKLAGDIKTPLVRLSSRRGREAGLEDVAKKILKRFDFEKAKGLVDRVKTYMKTKSDRDDISLEDSRQIYRPYDYGDVLSLSKKRDLDIDWTDHAEYRSDLRDMNPNMVNRLVKDWIQERFRKKGPHSQKVRMKLPGAGTAVVDYDTKKKPADADIVTVWASDLGFKSRKLEKAVMRSPSIYRLDTSGEAYIIGAFGGFSDKPVFLASTRSNSEAIKIVKDLKLRDDVSHIVVEKPRAGGKSWTVTESGAWKVRTAGIDLGPSTLAEMTRKMESRVRV